MIYNKDSREYEVVFYRHSRTGKEPALDFIKSLNKKARLKVLKYLEYLRDNNAYLDEPFSRHIEGKIRELRVDFANSRFRLFYFCVIGRKIIVLHAYSKKSARTPKIEIARAKNNLDDYLDNIEKYEG